ncbi:DNA-processing protein DprA [Rubripirellula amarantea]|nr:DNA-processing protein DprA [Rubripirellula amarantea]
MDEFLPGLDANKPASDPDFNEAALEAANAELANQGRGGVSAKVARSGPPRNRSQRDSKGWLKDIDEPVPSGIASQTLAPAVLDQLRLSSIPGVGPRTMAQLLEHFGSAKEVFAATPDAIMAVPGIGPKLYNQIKLESRHYDLDAIVHWCLHHDTEILVRGRSPYPAMLEDLEDAPPILFCRGELQPADELAVAIVGTRHATTYGLQQAERMAYALARAGVTVVSGLARGVDAAAHEGALNGGGRTIAVLGGGLAQMYPAEHEGLAKAIAADGAVISEHPPMTKTKSGLFPQRNRIVAGLSLATLVIEAPDRSGSLITARLAQENHRDVMALPGPVTSRASRGCNQLIRDGAILVQNIDDVLEQLGPLRQPLTSPEGGEVRNITELQLNEVERQVLEAIGDTATPIDDVIVKSEMPAHRVIAIISVLEIRRLVQRQSGQNVSRI